VVEGLRLRATRDPQVRPRGEASHQGVSLVAPRSGPTAASVAGADQDEDAEICICEGTCPDFPDCCDEGPSSPRRS